MEVSLEKVWELSVSPLRRFILARVEDADVAEDLLQEVFIRIHTRLGDLRDAERFEPWLYQIARNVIIDHYRSRRPSNPLDESIPAPQFHSTEPDAADEIARSLRGMVEQLPEPYREALLLTEFGALNQKQLADQLGLSFSGAKSRVQRARQMLKDELLNCCHFELDRYGRVVDYWALCCCCAASA